MMRQQRSLLHSFSYFTILFYFGLLLTPSVLTAQCVAGETGGTVWRDFNNDGIKDALETQGLSGVTVKAYSATGTLAGTTTTNASGQYTFGVLSPAPTAAAKYRIEFSGLPAFYQPTFNGTNGRTDVQFITAASCTIDYGLNNPADYCQANPLVSTTCFINGLASSGLDVLVSFPYNSSGNPGSYTLNHDALNSEIGSVWGIAYNKTTKKVFNAAFVKRHSDLGLAGLGGIYVTPFSASFVAGTPATLVDLDNFSAQVGSLGTAPASRGLGTPSAPSRDVSAFGAVGKVGLGDIDISDDGNTLYTVNLNTKRIIAIDLTAYNTSNTAISATNLSLLSAYPSPSCTNGTDRPFALKYYQGALYVGVVCDASTGTAANLTATIFKWNGTTWTTVLAYPLNYNRGRAAQDTDGPITLDGDFKPWTDNFVAATWQKMSGSDFINYSQPMFSDIEFDVDGSLVMSFMDRGGHQMGFLNYSPNTGDDALYFYASAGEILRAYNNNGVYVLENNGVVGGLTGCGATNSGPGGKEFYCGENFTNGTTIFHDETVVGGIGILPGKGETTVALYDPLGIISGGIGWMSNTNGSDLRGLALFRYNNFSTDTTLGKANGIGDVEFLCNTSPLQVGNYVWYDQDKDGVQDPSEQPLSNITVSLWKAGTQIASTTTNSSGEYYFSSKFPLGTAWTGTGADTALLANTAYEIRIDTTNQTRLDTVKLTTANATANNGNDQNDSDASVTGNYAVIAFTTGAAGSTNHTLDFGFFPCPTITTPSAAQTLCAGVAGTNITVRTNYNTASGIKFVKFTADQSVTNGTETATELAAIYAETAISTVTPTGASSPYTATYTWNSADFPNATAAPITYYVYAILNPDLGASCRPLQEIQITIKPTPSVTAIGNQTVCNGATTTAAFTGSSVIGTDYTWTNDAPSIGLDATGSGDLSFTAVNTGATPVIATVVVTPTAQSCAGATQTFTITVNPSVTAGTGTNPTTATCQAGSGLSNINLAGQITGATAGGTWSQTSGTAVGTALSTSTGVFNPNGIATGTYIFRYTVTGTAPCPNDTEDITVTIETCCPAPICIPVTITRN